MTTPHAELKRLAEAATHKQWCAFTDDSGSRPHTNLVSVVPITDCALSIPGAHKNDPNVAFIAAADPQAILSLIEENERMREAAEGLSAAISWLDYPFIDNNTSEDELRSRVGFMMKDAEKHRAVINPEASHD